MPFFVFAACAFDVAGPLAAAGVEGDGLAIAAEFELIERAAGTPSRWNGPRSTARLRSSPGRTPASACRWRHRPGRTPFRSRWSCGTRTDRRPPTSAGRRVQHEPIRVVAQELFGARVVVGGQRPRLRVQGRDEYDQRCRRRQATRCAGWWRSASADYRSAWECRGRPSGRPIATT